MGETEYPNSLNSRRQVKPSNIVFSTLKRVGEIEYPSSLTYPAKELCISLVTLRRKLIEDNSCQILTISDQYY
ncbi:hypothetical protein BHE74_00014078 [Ensete ventricosum]|nr:hypothetical protein GW17_00033776 [Ensete ventricosum]RWW77742.1 hypothetical protein BHE74_00014078 [Ensete ventricosum]RZR97349.1 hypothetical protein BHM03_00026501 [Ensete ventricosum]